jgi:hypothetical protein
MSLVYVGEAISALSRCVICLKSEIFDWKSALATQAHQRAVSLIDATRSR